MSTVVTLYGRRLVVSGSDVDNYFQGLSAQTDVTDSVLSGIRPFVAEDAVCLDVGANIGLYALAFSLLAPRGRVYAFEPSPGSFRHLEENLAANRASNVSAFQLAFGEEPDTTVQFHDVPFFTAGSFVVDKSSFLTSEVLGATDFEARGTTLDAFVAEQGLERVDVVKIDVEGAELSVLRGAGAVLAAHHPKVVLEFNSFGLTMHNGVLPQAALGHIRQTFPHVFVMDRLDGSLSELTTDAEAYAFLYDNGIHGPVDNLLCTFDDLGVDRPYTRRSLAEPTPAGTHTCPELEAMRRTVSWRVTAPLRWVRRRMPSDS